MYVDTVCQLVTPQIIAGSYEPITQAVVHHLVRHGDVVLEIGANQGFHTLSFAHLVGPAGQVIALEPNPRTFRYLRDNVTANGLWERVTLHEAAAADVDGSAHFRALASHSAGSHLRQTDTDWRDELDGTNITVTTIDIGRLISEMDPRPRLIKIDAEGAESIILASLAEVVKPSETRLLIEVIPDHNIDRLIEIVERLGYRWWACRTPLFGELTSSQIRTIVFEDVLLSVDDPYAS
jgi:FkbM family methyltransferase